MKDQRRPVSIVLVKACRLDGRAEDQTTDLSEAEMMRASGSVS